MQFYHTNFSLIVLNISLLRALVNISKPFFHLTINTIFRSNLKLILLFHFLLEFVKSIWLTPTVYTSLTSPKDTLTSYKVFHERTSLILPIIFLNKSLSMNHFDFVDCLFSPLPAYIVIYYIYKPTWVRVPWVSTNMDKISFCPYRKSEYSLLKTKSLIISYILESFKFALHVLRRPL